jgi:OmpA-OmpF porin, OOP family
MKPVPFTPRKTLISLALILGAGSAMAQDSGWYAGLGAGKAWSDIDNGGIASAVTASGSAVTTFGADDEDTTWKVLGGYSFTNNFALEASYFDLGQFGFNAGLLPAAQLAATPKSAAMASTSSALSSRLIACPFWRVLVSTTPK